MRASSLRFAVPSRLRAASISAKLPKPRFCTVQKATASKLARSENRPKRGAPSPNGPTGGGAVGVGLASLAGLGERGRHARDLARFRHGFDRQRPPAFGTQQLEISERDALEHLQVLGPAAPLPLPHELPALECPVPRLGD